MTGDLTLAIAIGAGLLSFLSPCVLPLVPGYLGQLTAVAVAGREGNARPSRWLAVRHSIAYVGGFAVVFTLLGVSATYAGGALFDWLRPLRIAGGLLLIVLGLNLAGLLRIPVLERSWRPLDAGAASSVASATGTVALGGGSAGGRGVGTALGSRLVSARGGWLASFGLGAVFAVGWTPCIGVILGSILTMAATAGTALQGGLLLLAYSLGLGIPFLALGLAYDRAPALIRPLVAHGRTVSLVGGLLVVAIGVALVFDWLALLPRYVPFNSQI
ncbi:MAG TPA: cytochrome c biogenesis protein CcdA [Candidatus Limnocylindrales bacterium]|nr:cytochrome c biogenesis protein CcdA [Candidatus Limnocylindrales bacterium]